MPLHETHGISSGRALADAQDEIYQLVLTINDRFPNYIVLRVLLLVLGRYRPAQSATDLSISTSSK